MNIPLSVREVFSSPSRVAVFLLTLLLVGVSILPLFVMVRTAFQSVGDPLQGSPDQITIAEARMRDLTAQNQPMWSGVWEDEAGFTRDPAAWILTDDVYESRAASPAFQFSWEGDLRRFRRITVEAPGTDSQWRLAWRDTAGTVAWQTFDVDNGIGVIEPNQNLDTAPSAAGEAPFDPIQISAFTLVPPGPDARWTRIIAEPRQFTFVNFVDVWRADNFSRYTFNSLFVAIFVTLGSVITSLCAGYAFARSESRIRHWFWLLVLGSMLIPAQVLLIPAFLILQHFPLFGGNTLFGQGGIGLLDSYSGLILPNLVMPLGIFLVRQSLLSMPDSYEEAAVMDGATIPKMLLHIIFPMQRPILATVGLLAFLFNWNSFIFPLILIQTPSMRTLPVGLALYSARNTVDWVHLMAASTLTALPIFIMFIFFQKQLIAGLVSEGVKG